MGKGTFAVGVILLALLGAGAVRAQGQATDSMARAVELYGAAEYEEALAVLDRLATSAVSPDDVTSVEEYRAFCLLALGRSSDAELAIATLVKANPTFVLSDSAVSPRVRTTFNDVRLRILPTVVQQQYEAAKSAFEKRDYAKATAGFVTVLRVLADPDVAPIAGTPPLSDLKTLAEGFRDLSTLAAPPSPAPAPAPAPAQASVPAGTQGSARPPTPGTVRPAAPGTVRPATQGSPPPATTGAVATAPLVADANRIYSASDTGVVPPVTLKQALPALPAQLIAMNQGVLELVIDEQGKVESAVLRASVHPRYDALLLDTAKSWRYEPAMRGGVPVKYRKLVQISLRRGQ
jgi:TonB family protein